MRLAATLAALLGVALAAPLGVTSAPGTTERALNRAPYWPSPRTTKTSTSFQYDDVGDLVGATTKITIVTKPVDPDRDRLRYVWKATNGAIKSNGPVATWRRVIYYGEPKAGTVTVTALDGRGGKAVAKFAF